MGKGKKKARTVTAVRAEQSIEFDLRLQVQTLQGV